MKLKKLVNVAIQGMSLTVILDEDSYDEPLVHVSWLFFGGKCMIPDHVMEMEVIGFSINANGNGLVVTVK